MSCHSIRTLFSGYLDGAINGREMQRVAAHLEHCAACQHEFEQYRGMQQLLEQAAPLKPPTDLGLRLRLAISHESARRQGHWYDGLSLAWDNRLRPALLQVSAGLASAVVLIGSLTLLIGMVAAPQAVLANDEPLGALTTPHFLYSVSNAGPLVFTEETTIVVQADVNAAGEIYDFTIVSGPSDAETQRQLRNKLMLQLYEPARVFGAPVRGHALITFSGVSVHA